MAMTFPCIPYDMVTLLSSQLTLLSPPWPFSGVDDDSLRLDKLLPHQLANHTQTLPWIYSSSCSSTCGVHSRFQLFSLPRVGIYLLLAL